MNRRNIHIEDGRASAFVAIGLAVPSSAQPRRGDAQILQFQARSAAASLALEDATSPSTFESVGEVAVRLVADWSLPRLVVMAVTGREEP